MKVWPDEGFPAQTHIFYLCLPMVFMYSFGSVSFGVGLKGKEGHAFGPSKNNKINIYYLYIFLYAYDSSPDEVLPKTSTMVFICILGSVPFGVGLKGKEGHAFGERKATLLDPQRISKTIFTISISFIMPTIQYLMKFCQEQVF